MKRMTLFLEENHPICSPARVKQEGVLSLLLTKINLVPIAFRTGAPVTR